MEESTIATIAFYTAQELSSCKHFTETTIYDAVAYTCHKRSCVLTKEEQDEVVKKVKKVFECYSY